MKRPDFKKIIKKENIVKKINVPNSVQSPHNSQINKPLSPKSSDKSPKCFNSPKNSLQTQISPSVLQKTLTMGQNIQIISEETSTQVTLPNNRVKISTQTHQKSFPLHNLNLSIVSESKELHLSNQGTLEEAPPNLISS